jgi:hypothetical protein
LLATFCNSISKVASAKLRFCVKNIFFLNINIISGDSYLIHFYRKLLTLRCSRSTHIAGAIGFCELRRRITLVLRTI